MSRIRNIKGRLRRVGRKRALGCLPRTTLCGEVPGALIWSGQLLQCPIVPRDDWETTESLREYNVPLNDQQRYPACTAASCSHLIKHYQYVYGREKLKPDWYKAWVEITGGKGGIALDTMVAYMVNQGFPLVGGGRLRARGIWDIPNVETYYSALYRRAWVLHGVFVGKGGHAEFAASMQLETDKTASSLVPGTWGPDFGDKGWYPRRESEIRRGLPTFGAFAVTSFELRPEDIEAGMNF